ncbi:kinesin-like protein KIF21A isoform X4 [Octopus sinensis]|uniref:Kinesin-like protein KIF21A isoform X4 n=1 Tax=Octopus sinensis TaxID=2607531 RepID=A0A7E6EYT4_9MOLL|nr:kinesin-like protein KIF21A isoform X4 [Octopus sinensis]
MDATQGDAVKVALRIRPQCGRERIDMCQICTDVIYAESQLILGKDKAFTFDYVFDRDTVQKDVYETCVQMLVEGCFEGYNATVFAYGQTGSGKTYTMGSGFDVDVPTEDIGIIPRAIGHLFSGIDKRKKEAMENKEPPPTFKVSVQFMELYNEEILDLLDPAKDLDSRNKKSHIKVHEDASGGIYVVGVNTRPVDSLNATLQLLKGGALSRATASTKMNVQSSRSHAIFSLHIKQDRIASEIIDEEGKDDSSQPTFETLTAKFHFVDLAGSERLKRTGATGDRAKEGISINCGLLALGNVISALGDKTKKGCHVPYRDSKLTRLLQDSLGGNSRTLMIACISPSDRDFMETLNTLKYANRAKNIRNVVVANQDKASKLLAQLRTENSLLQKELLEYKTGKRLVDSDGVEGMNDFFAENTMLQSENEKLRQRLKAMTKTVEGLRDRNIQLATENNLYKQSNSEPLNNEQLTTVIQNYSKETESLRAKLAEAESRCKVAQTSASRAQSRLALSPRVPMSSSLIEVPNSPEINNYDLLKEANEDLRSLKEKIKYRTGGDGQESDKENICEGNIQLKNNCEGIPCDSLSDITGEVFEALSEEFYAGEEMVEEDSECFDFNTDDTDEEEDLSSSDIGMGSDNVHENLAELTCEMTLKERLIEALEKNQNKLNAMKTHYEQKVQQLQLKIRETEVERDKIISNIEKVESDKKDKVKNVNEKYQQKLNNLQQELKKLQEAKKEHAKLIRNQAVHEKQLKTYQLELQEMKRIKVRLMKQIKEEAEKNKVNDAKKHKEITQLRKAHLKKEQRIKNLETEKHQKEIVLKRKQEEVEALRKRQRPMSDRAAGRVGRYNTYPAQSSHYIPMSPHERQSQISSRSDRLAKKKWDAIQKKVEDIVNKRQTLSLIEKDMETWLKERRKLGQNIEKYTKKKETLTETQQSQEAIDECVDVIESLEGQLQLCQEHITEIQEQIMHLEENKNNDELEKLQVIYSKSNHLESQYLFRHLMESVLSKGTLCANKETELKELQAKLHQCMVNNNLQQDILKHMMADRIDIDMEEFVQNDAETESISSGSTSPVDNMFDRQRTNQLSPNMATGESLKKAKVRQCCQGLQKPIPARRRTATPKELLYSVESSCLDTTLTPLQETSQEETTSPDKSSSSSPKSLVKSVDTLEKIGLSNETELQLSPIPLRRVNSASDATRPNKYSEPVSPLRSPQAPRKRSNDVFKRLTSKSVISSPESNRGTITQLSRINSGGRSSPIFCSHIVEGHAKPVLSVYATEDLLFTGSKDRTAKVWDLNTGHELQVFPDHPNNVVALKYDEPSHRLYTVSLSEVKVWDIRDVSKPNCVIAFNSSGFASAPISYQTRQSEVSRHENLINAISLSDDGQTLFTAVGNLVRMWDLRNFSCINKLTGHQAQVMVLASTSNAESQLVVSGSKDHYIKIFEVNSMTSNVASPTYNLEPPHFDGVQSLVIQDQILFSGSRDRCIKKWNLKDKRTIQSLYCAHKDWINGLAVMPEHQILLSGCRSGYLKLWQTEGNCSAIGEIKAHNFPITALTTNKSAIFTASNDCTVGIWKKRNYLEAHRSSCV